MNALALGFLFLPASAMLPMLVLAGLLMVFGLRRAAALIVVMVLLVAVSPLFEPVFDALFAEMPWWFAPLFIIALVALLFGSFVRDVVVHVLGDLIASSIRFVVARPLLLGSLAAFIAALAAFL